MCVYVRARKHIAGTHTVLRIHKYTYTLSSVRYFRNRIYRFNTTRKALPRDRSFNVGLRRARVCVCAYSNVPEHTRCVCDGTTTVFRSMKAKRLHSPLPRVPTSRASGCVLVDGRNILASSRFSGPSIQTVFAKIVM